ncbi:MAG: hypothetical protein CV087_00175 [Candidatus Brocadia sp. WS118]|nr:MAG: hypothetical protein CV087_00175 [Candidatus Brocadia sp. WS118]
MKKDDALTLKIRELRERAREKVQKELIKEFEAHKTQGIYPWEGIWLSPQDIRKVQEKMKTRDKVVFLEIILLFFVFGFFSYVLYRLMKIFLLP